MKKLKNKKLSAVEKQAAKKVKIAKKPLVPNKLPFDKGTAI